ncbi:mandelate racemase/muconate lactonizing enzyme family protein [Enterocloster lavalensis]|uniref:mandelate racemase/muconate lactonizing enzyme family protein n=1 Tax=Enterocloster lavalensis TaxID=460384 RepID=UPI001D06E321|nr:mandelate racemase/muconate lactonizing enzyme family protein [Enterocloster lavalensis]MBS5604637.1 mandelate racemase/muconate lactonizing enzyme family protein [Enterocloster asparagiformis]MCB6345118.1 mandelate racemase/muconate lactonizing enzyme family protein [Enterocloster lavalensis]
MKITDIKTIRAEQYLFVQVYTDEGITGLGESGTWAYLEASEAVIHRFKHYLIGQNPLQIEHHWQYLYRAHHFRGSAIMGALAAIDIALWDIAGKYHNVPSYMLLGGKCRDKVRTYFHVIGDSTEKLVEGCIRAKELGFTAVGHLTPFLDDGRDAVYNETYVQKMTRAADRVRRYREAVGDEVDICLELHRRMSPAEAIVLGQEVAPYHPYFYEDPVLPDNMDSMAWVAEHINIPIATGERLLNIQEFSMLLRRNAVHFVRPCVCAAGGLSHAKKVAALAEAFNVQVVPHNPLGPVSTAVSVQLAACIPNFAIQEYSNIESSEIVKKPVELKDGYLIVPDAPGIGVELQEDLEKRHPYRMRQLKTKLNYDGSVVDR